MIDMIVMVVLLNGEMILKLGLGIWEMGEWLVWCVDEIVVLCEGVEFGMMLVDIVEMYGDGVIEEFVGDVFVGLCDDVFFVSKVYLYYVSWCGVVVVCDVSFKCLCIDCVDLYLLYWCGLVLFEEIVVGFDVL